MAVIEVTAQESLGRLREKFNSLSANVGDLTTLDTTEQSNIVDASNELHDKILLQEHVAVMRAMALS